jgi:hypothetical protein
MISILEFLRTGHFGSVHIGMSRSEVVANLGVPDWYYPNDENVDHMSASFWSYGGVQLFFDSSINLNRISFKPGYFYDPDPTDTKVDPWIFEGGYEPTKQAFTIALQNEDIEVKDTGVLLIVHDKKVGKSRYIYTESEIQPGDELVLFGDEGFLVLKSSVEVLYGGNKVIPNVYGQDGTNKVLWLGVATGGYFTIKNQPLENLRSSW